MKKWTLVLLFVLLSITISGCQSDAKFPPSEAQNYLRDTLSTRGYKSPDGDFYFASSDYLELGSKGLGLRNNLAYYVLGDRRQVKELRLVLTIHDASRLDESRQLFLKTASQLVTRALGMNVSEETQKMLISGEGFQYESDGAIIKSRSENSGKAYITRFTIRPVEFGEVTLPY